MNGGMWALNKLESLMGKRTGVYYRGGAIGLVDCHRHLDTEGTLTEKDYLRLEGGLPLNEKWRLMDEIKKRPEYIDELPERLDTAITAMARQGIDFCQTYCPVDSTVGLHVIEAMLSARARWAERPFTLQVFAYPFKGLDENKEIDLAWQATELADGIGLLPSRGRENVTDIETSRRNLFMGFAIANALHKPLSAQIDQDNDPDERESYILVSLAKMWREKKGYQERISAVHCTSLAAHRSPDWDGRNSTIYLMGQLKIGVIVCPSASITSRQNEMKIAPLHNSIAPIRLMLKSGVTVGIGTDNVSDIYIPSGTGNFRGQILRLWEAIRWQESLDTIAAMATTNGRAILGV